MTSFGAYLRNLRKQRGMTLDELSARTKIKRHLLTDVEEDDLSRWPKYLVYRYGYIRSIADALDVDREEMLDHFDEAFPEYERVAFDSGKKSRPRRPAGGRAAAMNALVTPGAATLAVALGLAIGLVLSMANGRTPKGPTVAESDRPPAHAGSDIRLDPEPEAIPGRSSPEAAESNHVQVAAIDPSTIEGEVRVLSNPPNAVVAVNGVGRGRTPTTVRFLPLGSHTIRVVQFGYKARELRVTLTPDQPVRRVRVALRPRDDHRTAVQ